MMAVLAKLPVTIPAAFTEAMPALLLLHVPDGVVLLNVVVWPRQTVAVPVIAAGVTNTVTIAVAEQPVPTVYNIVVVPAERPATTPVAGSIVPTVKILLLHVPPALVLSRSVVLPSQTVSDPAIAGGIGETVTMTVRRQPVANE
jgi:hypothetical protein